MALFFAGEGRFNEWSLGNAVGLAAVAEGEIMLHL